MSTADVSAALDALEALASTSATSSSGPLNALLEQHFAVARERILAGSPPKHVIAELQTNIAKAKKQVERGLKTWYAALGNTGKAVEKAFPPTLSDISSAYDDPPLFTEPEAAAALDRVVLDSLGRRGLWDAVLAFEAETDLAYDASKRDLSARLAEIVSDIEAGDLSSALAWCHANAAFLSSGPHPSPLPYHLHRAMLLAQPTPAAAVEYARTHMFEYLATQPVLELVTSRLFMGTKESPYEIENAPLAQMFRTDYCRCHGWAREDPLEVAVDLGSRGGALNAIEKARKVMGDRLGNVRTWPELPMEVHLPRNRRYHSVFVCPVSKEQASDTNPPTMLSCGHVINQESFNRLLKGNRKSAKCPYCPDETGQQGAQTLYL
ncbi:negative regulation of gluconeogenesis-related protein [Trichosporon asahii var. asahii CBS 8904]|uniref:GID complex catalytic subunit 2 n=1 Tax=Trichosporon asahii var. asahii (strain CBS 8904) TaxID=1220162 RepID=K1W740_TRIAC|nr:negative regulation of gluconeogenesis-related protein [Trichosporon asahii var. asahii CBS 8904]